MVGVVLSHIIAELSLKRIGFKRLKIGWFWLIEILLSVIIIKYIENIIESIVHLATGTWSPGQAFEGITGILAIVSAVIVGLILFLSYAGKIKVDDKHSSLNFFEMVTMKDLQIESLLDGFRKEIIIICGPSTNFITTIMECISKSKEISRIEKLCILGQDFEITTHFDSPTKPKNKEVKGMLTPLLKKSEEKSTRSDPFSNHYSKLLSYVDETFRQKYSGVIDFRMSKQPIYKSVVLIVSYDYNKQSRYTELYTEPFMLMGMDHQQIVYKFRSTSKSKKIDEKAKYDLLELEYSNFLKFWESTADIEKVTMEKKLKSDRSFNQNPA